MTPQELLPIARGTTAELHIEGVLRRRVCFVQVDLAAFALRWTRTDSVSLHLVVDVLPVVDFVEQEPAI
jgi:hypothetical protein